MPNLELTKMPMSTWRKLSVGTWHNAGDPSVYGMVELNATKLEARRKALGDRAPTVTAVFARAVALLLKTYPDINAVLRWGKLYRRKHVTLFLQTAVDAEGKELSGVLIEKAEHKSLAEIGRELAAKAAAVRENRDPAFKKAKSTFGKVPGILMRPVLNLMSFLLYELNLDLRWMGVPRDPFGSVMITSIGSIGMDEAFAPLVAYSKVPLLLVVGAIRPRAIVIDGQVAVAPTFKVCVTFDHRFVDGMVGAKMVRDIRRLIETDEGLDELGLLSEVN